MSKKAETADDKKKSLEGQQEMLIAIPKFDLFTKQMEVMKTYLKKLRFTVGDLENRKFSLEVELKRLTAKRADVEQTVSDRIASMDRSVQDLYAEANRAKIEAREAKVKSERHLADAVRQNEKAEQLLSGAIIQSAADKEVAERTGTKVGA